MRANVPSERQLKRIPLPNLLTQYDAYREARRIAEQQGITLEQLIRNKLEARGMEVVRFISRDYEHSVEVEVLA